MFKNIDHRVLYTDASFKNYGDKNDYILGQVPYHRSRRFYFNFLFGLIPEWRGRYSHKWIRMNLCDRYTTVYAFVYSAECIKFADWISDLLGIPLLIHLADHSMEFESVDIVNILTNCTKLICITDEMQ